MGKTQLAVEFAHRYGPYFAGGVFWLSFADPKNIAAECAACGSAMPEMPTHFASQDAHTMYNLVRDAWCRKVPRLLIFDGCEDEALLNDWRPTTGGCRTLITCRNQQLDRVLGVQQLVLQTLPRAQSIELLRKFRPELPADSQELTDIALELGDLPLALHLAGRYLEDRRRAVTPDRYLAQIRRPDLFNHLSLQWNSLSPTEHDPHVARTFALSYDQLRTGQSLDNIAQTLLACAACFAPGEPIPWFLLAASVAGDDQERNELTADALNRLLALGLIEEAELDTVRPHQLDAVRLHRLIALYVNHIAPEQVLAAQTAVEIAVAEAALQGNTAGRLDHLLPWQVHLRYVTDNAVTRRDEIASRLCSILGINLNDLGDYQVAKHYLEQSLTIRRKVLDEDHPDIATSLNNLGVVLQNLGEHPEAQHYYEQSLAIGRKVLDEDHPDIATSLNNLGVVLRDQGDLAEAKRYYEQSLAIRRKVLGDDHPSTATSLHNLGSVLKDLGDLQEAKQHLEQSLTIQRKLVNEDHPDIAISLSNLGVLLRDLGDYQGAKHYHEQSLAIRRKVLTKEHPDIAISLNNLGVVLRAMNDLPGAKYHLEQALALQRTVLPEEHPSTATTLHNLGLVLRDQDDLAEAKAYLKQALDMRRTLFDDEHPAIAQSLNGLGSVLKAMGDIAEAKTCYERALAIRRKLLPADHTDIALSLNNLGTLLRDQSDLLGAKTFYEQALYIVNKRFGPDHPDTKRVRENLENVLTNLNVQ
jgi:tetratricopeptide (TPR) repeat protein